MNNNFGDQDPMDQNTDVNVFSKEIRIHKIKKKRNFTQVENSTIDDFDISEGKEFCLFMKLLSMPDDWTIHPNSLAKKFNCSYKVFYTYFTRLVNKGYAKRRIIREKKIIQGREREVITSYEYDIYEESFLLDSQTVRSQDGHTTNTHKNNNTYTSTSPNKKNVIQNPPLGGDITSGVKTPVKQPRSGDRFLDKSFSQKEDKKVKPTPKAPKQRHMFQKARELLAEKKPLELLNKEQRAKAFGIARGNLKPMHDLKTGVKFHLGTAANYVARGIIAGFDEYQIVDRYRQALSERHADKPYGHKAWDLSSTVTLAFEKLDSDGLTIRERYEKNKPLRKKDDSGESSVDWDEWAKQFNTSVNGKDA